MIVKPQVIDRGSGPTIEGTRTTVYHVMDYYIEGMHPLLIGAHLRLSTPEVGAAIEYIDAHRAEVDEDYRIILERCERGNSPEIRAKMEAGRPAFEAKVAEIFRKAAEAKPIKLAGSASDVFTGA